jgi:hypothetical protein
MRSQGGRLVSEVTACGVDVAAIYTTGSYALMIAAS